MNYLDTTKSLIISSPAGSGKTEKLARRYIALLQKGVDIERILAITFTDKAAAEMKQRILRILREDDETLFSRLLESLPLMRVSTIHSFCGTLLRRFSFEAEIDPNYKVADAMDSIMTWEEILYEVLMDAGKREEGHELLLQTLGEKGFRGLEYLKNTADYLFRKTPFSLEADTFFHASSVSQALIDELKSWQGVKEVIGDYEKILEGGSFTEINSLEKFFLTDKKVPRKRPAPSLKNIIDYQDWASKMYCYWKDKKIEEHRERTERIKEIFKRCLHTYNKNKKTKGTLDFSDLEYLSYKMLTQNPEWANILYAFDEKTDHILVDEFQDTNTFQWAIIDKLTEEWRSGMGSKREEGIRPTIFLVGDEKQSIYFFRGANVGLFKGAKEKLQKWLEDEFCYEEVKENFRSRPAIIDFTNYVFSRIMQPKDNSLPWITKYNAFSACRTDTPDSGRVEIVLLDDDSENTSEAKHKEAEILAQRIQGLVGDLQITDKNTQLQKPCTYMDIAVLLRKRTHLKIYEEALRRYNIPFVAVKGIGFYQEPEIAMLRALVFFLSNPRDDYSLYILLRGPLFNIDEGDIITLINKKGDSFFSKLQSDSSPDKSDTADKIKEAAALLKEWLLQIPHLPVTELIENILVRTRAWRRFHEAQRRANMRKFIRVIEDLEANGKSLLKIRDLLERTFNKNEEPKANVNTEGMDAVKIMTVHASKGLEFPVVFIPALEESFVLKTSDNLVYEKDGKFFFKSEPESSIRKQDEDFLVHLAKEEEEQKRLFYVAVTRAEDALFLISRWSTRDKNFLSFLKQGLGMERMNKSYIMEAEIQGLSLLSEENVKMLYEHANQKRPTKTVQPALEVLPFTIEKQLPWKAVTETVDIKRRHGKDWMTLGDILHRIFEGISKGEMQEREIRAKVEKLLESRGFHKEQKNQKTAIIEKELSALKGKGIWQDIILPVEHSYSELPFIFATEDVVYTGRIDRIIKDNDVYKIYDYKTFPVKEKEKPHLLKEYSIQLDLYKKAVRELFNAGDVKSFIVFTHTGEVIEV
jgi:ATP-dependent helicase/nuclease subunit A